MKKINTTTPFASTIESEINEQFLHYVWKTKNFDVLNLKTTTGKDIRILNWGIHNHNAGPDFLNAKVEYNQSIWSGHIEIHIRSSDWYRHHHQLDPAYDQVILHVVWKDDRPVSDSHLTPIPTIELNNRVDPDLWKNVQSLYRQKYKIPCIEQINQLSCHWLESWYDKQFIERLQLKTAEILSRLKEVNGNWDQVAFELLGRSMGFHSNGKQIQELAKEIGWSRTRKHGSSTLDIQSLFFGVGGFLERPMKEEYPRKIKNRWIFLKLKHEINPSNFIKWNLKGARPFNYPTIRLAQFSHLLTNKNSIIGELKSLKTLHDIKNWFHIEINTYWQSHYRFEKTTNKTSIHLSTRSKELLCMNFAIPILYAYAHFYKIESNKDQIIDMVRQLKPDKNRIIDTFREGQLKIGNALTSQALLHTYHEYCSQRRCLSCQAGHMILNNHLITD